MDRGICLFKIEMQRRNTRVDIFQEQLDSILKKLLTRHLIFHSQFPHRSNLRSIVFLLGYRAVSELGISNDDNIVVYDGLHVFSAGRTYFLFKYFGHKNVSCLDGGLPAWKRAEGPLS